MNFITPESIDYELMVHQRKSKLNFVKRRELGSNPACVIAFNFFENSLDLNFFLFGKAFFIDHE